MSRLSRHLYVAGSLGLLAVAGLHTWGHLSSNPRDPQYASFMEPMRAFVLKGMGVTKDPSVADVYESMSWFMSIALAALGFMSLAAFRDRRDPELPPPGALKVNLLAVGAMVLLWGVYSLAPPFYTLLFVQILFGASWLFMSASERRRGRVAPAAPTSHY